jgi:hypothetical protein
MTRRIDADQFTMAGRFAAISQWVRRSTVPLQFRRGTLFLTNIGVPVLVGLARNESAAALIGGITGLFLSLADTEVTRFATFCKACSDWPAISSGRPAAAERPGVPEVMSQRMFGLTSIASLYLPI